MRVSIQNNNGTVNQYCMFPLKDPIHLEYSMEDWSSLSSVTKYLELCASVINS